MHPLAEYPRPAMRRDSCKILNGPWQYAITQTAEYPAAWQGSILVPYSPEAPASGVGRTLQPGQWLHYHRLFAPPAGEGGRVSMGATLVTPCRFWYTEDIKNSGRTAGKGGAPAASLLP